jgi:hypothetical protein
MTAAVSMLHPSPFPPPQPTCVQLQRRMELHGEGATMAASYVSKGLLWRRRSVPHLSRQTATKAMQEKRFWSKEMG